MSTKVILLLVVLTAVMIALSLSLFNAAPEGYGIDLVRIYPTSEQSFSNNDRVFNKNEDEIFLEIKTNNLNERDFIQVVFKREDGSMYQQNEILLENHGSSLITISLLKVNDEFMPLAYHAEVFLNGDLAHEISFTID
jgi:hypothetical protein